MLQRNQFLEAALIFIEPRSPRPYCRAMTTIALIVAAGSGSRTGLAFPKQYLSLDGHSVLHASISAFIDHPDIDHVQVIIDPADKDLYADSTQDLDLLPWVAGGNTRQASVRYGLDAIASLNPDHVLIHDAARPFVSADVIDRCLEALRHHKAVLPALPVTDTLKMIDGDQITGTLDRSQTVAAQTPQCFNFKKIFEAHQKFKQEAVTDDIALAELADIDIHWVLGSPENMKITTSDDVDRLCSRPLSDIRTGQGFDVHAFDAARDMWLGGIQIPYHQGLKGHSDADVALHALTDALLGAIGAGDIGSHFPPDNAQWKGASSDRFLAHAAKLITDKGGKIANIDLTIICEAPKIGPYRTAMIDRIAAILDIDPNRVSVKGTTTEKLGFTGRGEGIAAQAIATVRLPE